MIIDCYKFALPVWEGKKVGFALGHFGLPGGKGDILTFSAYVPNDKLRDAFASR
jgi:hypothetical protein